MMLINMKQKHFFRELTPICCDYACEVGYYDEGKTLGDAGKEYLAKVIRVEFEFGSIRMVERDSAVIKAAECDNLIEISPVEYGHWNSLVEELNGSVNDLLADIRDKQ